MIATTSSSPLLQPYESLQRRRRICARLHWASSFDFGRLWQAPALKFWTNNSESSLLLIRGTVPLRSQTQAAATFLTDLLNSGKFPVLWALKPPNFTAPDSSTRQLLKYLVMQALQLDPNGVGGKLSPGFNAALVASATTEHDWIKILGTLLSGHACVYLIIDPEMLGSSTRYDSDLDTLVRLLQSDVIQRSATVVKIALVGFRRFPLSDWCNSSHAHTHAVSLAALMQSGTNPSTHGRGYRAEMRQRSALAFKRRVSGGFRDTTGRLIAGDG